MEGGPGEVRVARTALTTYSQWREGTGRADLDCDLGRLQGAWMFLRGRGWPDTLAQLFRSWCSALGRCRPPTITEASPGDAYETFIHRDCFRVLARPLRGVPNAAFHRVHLPGRTSSWRGRGECSNTLGATAAPIHLRGDMDPTRAGCLWCYRTRAQLLQPEAPDRLNARTRYLP
jgi:hypothetical protein